MHLICFTFSPIMSAVRRMTRRQGPTVLDADADNAAASSVESVHSETNDSPRLAHSGLCNSSSVTYFRQPPNLPTAARRNRKCTECDTTAFGRNRMSAESAHLSTSGAETEAEIRSTSNCYCSPKKQGQNWGVAIEGRLPLITSYTQ